MFASRLNENKKADIYIYNERKIKIQSKIILLDIFIDAQIVYFFPLKGNIRNRFEIFNNFRTLRGESVANSLFKRHACNFDLGAGDVL